MKKLLTVLLVLIVLAGGGLYYAWNNLDHFIKVAVEKYGTQATQANVSLGGVKLALTTGEGSLSNFSIGNPKGFSSAKSVKLDDISVSVDVNSIRGTGPIVIRKVVINKPEVAYEIADDGSSNLQTIARNAKSYTASLTSKGKPAQAEQKTATPDGQGRKIIINELVMNEGQVGISQAALEKLSGSKSVTAKLPTLRLTNIGKVSNGVTAAQAAGQILGAITNSAAQVASKELAGQLTSSVKEKAEGVIKAKAEGATNQLKGLLNR